MTHRPLRHERTRDTDPCSIPLPVPNEHDLVLVDTTWGKGQPLQPFPDVQTVGELELISLVESGAAVVDTRVAGSRAGVALPNALSIPHDQIREKIAELAGGKISILFCNGPQCPQTPRPSASCSRLGTQRRRSLLPRRRSRLGDSGLSDSPRVAAATGSPWCVSEQPCVGFKGPSRRCTELPRRRQCRKCPRRPCPSQPWLLPSSPGRVCRLAHRPRPAGCRLSASFPDSTSGTGCSSSHRRASRPRQPDR